MKKLFVSVGLVAVGTSAVCAAGGVAAMGMGDNTKNWSVAATLRGFYDDNYATASKGTAGTNDVRDSFGVTIRPSIAYSVPMDNTSFGIRYTFGATWYEDRENQNSANDPWDYSHEFAGYFNHDFNDHYSVDAMDSFVISQEPELLASGPVATPYRTEGNNIRNHAEINFNGTFTKKLQYVIGYQNTYYNYENDGGNFTNPSLSGLLDRMEQIILVNLRYQAAEKTVLVVGYNYGMVDYSSDETIALVGPTQAIPATSDFRNNHSHYFYGGIDQNFSKNLMGSFRAGAQIIDYYNDPQSDSQTTPYLSGNLTYAYRPSCTVTLGATHSRNQTDVVSPDPTTGQITQDQQTTVVYLNIHHRFDSKISGNLFGQWQDSQYNGGAYDSQNDTYMDVGFNLNYRFNNHLIGEVGYTFSQLSSDIAGRDYDRNRIYVGVSATY